MPLKRPAPSAPAHKKPRVQPKQVGSLFGLVDPSSPFAGVSGTRAPAKEKGPTLTELAAQARARQQRLTPGTGGLIPKPALAAERQAATVVPTKTRFASPPKETAPPPKKPAKAAAPAAPAQPEVRAAGRSAQLFTPDQIRQPAAPLGPVGAWVGKNVLAPAYVAGDKAVATGVRDTFAKFTGVGGPSIIEDFTHPHEALADSRKRGYVSSAQLAQNIGEGGLKRPDISIPAKYLDFGVGTAHGAQFKPEDRVPFQTIADQSGWGLSPEGKKLYRELILKQGWNPSDIDGKSAPTMIAMAYSPPPALWKRIAQNAAANLVMGGSTTVGMLGLGSQVLQGQGVQAGKDLVGSLRSITPGLSNHPWQDTALTNPLFAVTAAHAVAKGGGGALGMLKPGLRGERVVPLAGLHRLDEGHVGEQAVAARGRYSRNLYTAAGQGLDDLLTRHSPRHAAKVAEDVADEYVRAQRNLHAEEHIAVQVPYKAATHKLSNDRQTELIAFLDHGGDTGVATGLAHYRAEAAGGNVAAERHVRLLEDLQGPKNETEQAFVDHARAISKHTSDVRQSLGLHGATAQKFRQYETPIETGASTGNQLAIDAKAARESWQNLWEQGADKIPTGRLAKLAEITRDVTRHGKKAEKATKTIERRQAEWDAWSAKDKEIRSRRPTLEPATDVLSTHATLKEASAAAKKAQAAEFTGEGGATRVKVEKEGDRFVVRTGAEPKRAEGTMGPHRKAVKAWRDEMAAHQAAKPPKPIGVARAKGKQAAHQTEVNQQGKRLERLQPDETLPFDEQAAIAKQRYEDATQAFIDDFHARGGIEPARIARTKIKSGIAHPSRLAGKHRFTTKTEREHLSTGESVRSGEFVYDPKSLLHENAQIQRIRGHVGVWNDIASHPMVHFVKGSTDRANPTLVPKGYVAVMPDNYRSAARTAPEWNSNTPMSMHDVEHEHGIREKAAAWLSDKAATAGERVPAGVEVALMPAAMHKRIIEWAKPVSKDGKMAAYDRAMANYQRILIGIYPSTWVGNAPGSVPLAMASGAIHPMDYWSAFKSGHRASPISRRLGIEKGEVPAPSSVQGLGASGSSFAQTSNPAMKMVGFGRELSMMGEDFSARAAWAAQVRRNTAGHLPTLRKIFPKLDEIMPEKWKGRAAQLSVTSAEYARALATGRFDNGKRLGPEDLALQNRLLDETEAFMGVSGKPKGGISQNVGRVVLFQNWLGHILKLNLFTLPIRHPRRATLMNAIAVYGNQYRQENGVYPDWMGQFFPIGNTSEGGNPMRLSLGLGQLTPLASATNLASAGSRSLDEGTSPEDMAISMLNPILQAGAKAIRQYDNNQTNQPWEKDINPAAVAVAGLERALPGSSKFISGLGGGSGYETGSYWPTNMKKKTYYKYVLSKTGKSFNRVEIPWDDRPGGRPVQGLLGPFSRWGGLPLEQSPTGGKPLRVEQSNAKTFGHLDKLARAKG